MANEHKGLIDFHYFLSILCLMECGLRSNWCCKTGLPCLYDLSLHKNIKNCIARHNFKLENDGFSNENRGPGILEFCWQRRPSKCIKKTSWFMLYSGIRYVSLAGDFCSKLRVLNLQKIQKIFVKMSIINPNSTNIANFNRFWKCVFVACQPLFWPS